MSEDILAERDNYKYGFYTDIETEEFPKGLNEDIIRLISNKKEEPEWMLEFRLKAFAKGEPPSCAKDLIPPPNLPLPKLSAPKSE